MREGGRSFGIHLNPGNKTTNRTGQIGLNFGVGLIAGLFTMAAYGKQSGQSGLNLWGGLNLRVVLRRGCGVYAVGVMA